MKRRLLPLEIVISLMIIRKGIIPSLFIRNRALQFITHGPLKLGIRHGHVDSFSDSGTDCLCPIVKYEHGIGIIGKINRFAAALIGEEYLSVHREGAFGFVLAFLSPVLVPVIAVVCGNDFF